VKSVVKKSMKRVTTILALLTSCCLAQQDPFGDGRGAGNHVERDPFGDPGPPRDTGPYIPPPNIRIFLQYIEVSHADLTNLMADAPSGAALHGNAMALVEKRVARIMDSAILVVQSGHRAYLESFKEVIVPTEYGLPTMSMDPPPTAEQIAKEKEFTSALGHFARSTPSGWDTRNTGLTVQLDPVLSKDRRTVDLFLAPEWVEYHGNRIIRSMAAPSGKSDLKMPDFRTQRCVIQLSLTPEVIEFSAALNPLVQAPAPAQSTKVLLFVRCEVLGAPGN